MVRLTINIIVSILVVILGFVQCSAITEQLPTYDETSIVEQGDVAPDFTATLLGGDQVTLSELRGEVVLLILFSHTCPDCKALFDDLRDDIDAINNLGVRVLAIARDGSEEQVCDYLEENDYNVDAVADTDRAIYNLYATMYVPRCYLINTLGVVECTTVEYHQGDLERLLSKMREICD